MKTKYSKLLDLLTKRELQIANHLVGFDSYKTIGSKLCITPSTCRKHASNIFLKVGLENNKRIEFRKMFSQISQYIELRNGYPLSNDRNENPIVLNWTENNSFESYYVEFSRVMEAMYNGNFKLRLKESEDKDSIESFIAKGINTVNEELENEYLDSKVLISILNSFNLKNRILILSKNGKTVNHIFLFSEEIIIRPEALKGALISDLFLNCEANNENNLNVRLNPKTFLSNSNHIASVETIKTNELTIFSATICPEDKFEKLAPRILALISTMAEQHADSPIIYNSVIENAISTEANELYNELKEYMLTYKMRLT